MSNQQQRSSQQDRVAAKKKDSNPIGIRSVAAAAEMVKHQPKHKATKTESEQNMPVWLRDDRQ